MSFHICPSFKYSLIYNIPYDNVFALSVLKISVCILPLSYTVSLRAESVFCLVHIKRAFHSDQNNRVWQKFSVKGQVVNILAFAGLSCIFFFILQPFNDSSRLIQNRPQARHSLWVIVC